MAVDVADTVRQCDVCSRNRTKERTRTSYLKLFPASSPLTYVSIDILGPLPNTNHGNRFLLGMTDRFSKLTRTVPLLSTSAYAVAKAVCDHRVFMYGPPCHFLTDNAPKFASKFLLATCRKLGIDKLFPSAYHPQMNGPVERFNMTILNSLRGYVSEHQDDWDE
jgi:transposase InsO family protein